MEKQKGKKVKKKKKEQRGAEGWSEATRVKSFRWELYGKVGCTRGTIGIRDKAVGVRFSGEPNANNGA